MQASLTQRHASKEIRFKRSVLQEKLPVIRTLHNDTNKLFRFYTPSQNTNVYHMVVQCSQMFANIKHCITVINENLFDVCEDSSKCEKRLCLLCQIPGF